MARHKYFDPQKVAALGRMKLVAREVVEGLRAGMHRSPYQGSSVEFAEHRVYVRGEDLRNIDWRLYGRTDRLYVKLFESETNLKCYLLLDQSASMAYGSGGLTKLQYACYLAASLAYLILSQQDAVGLVTFDERIDSFLAPSARLSHLRHIFERLDQTSAVRGTDTARTFHDLAANIKRRSLIIILSDLLDDRRELMRALHHFRHRKHSVILFHVMDHAELTFPFRRLSDFVDMETGARLQVDPLHLRKAYLEEIETFRNRLRRDCSESRIEYVPIDTQVPFERALMRFLALRSKF